MGITYTATLPVRDETVLRISALLHANSCGGEPALAGAR